MTLHNEYDYGTVLVRATAISYASLGNILDKPSSVVVRDPSNNTVAQTTYTYDEGTVAGTTGTPQHGPVTNPRGNLTTLAAQVNATVPGVSRLETQLVKLTDRFGELITLTVDQRVETAKIANQLIENQRQLIATQQILIRLMERSIELARHITTIEEKLPAVFELPRMVETLRVRVAQLEGVEVH